MRQERLLLKLIMTKMIEITKYAHQLVQLELLKAKLEVFPNKRRRVEVDLIVKTSSGRYYELYFLPINLERERSVKILKEDLGELKENLWISLVLFMEEMEPVLYLIPSKTLAAMRFVKALFSLFILIW